MDRRAWNDPVWYCNIGVAKLSENPVETEQKQTIHTPKCCVGVAFCHKPATLCSYAFVCVFDDQGAAYSKVDTQRVTDVTNRFL